MFFKTSVLKHFAVFTEKYLLYSFFIKQLQWLLMKAIIVILTFTLETLRSS